MSLGLQSSLMLNVAVILLAGVTMFWKGGIKKVPMTFVLVPIQPITCTIMGSGFVIAALVLAWSVVFPH